MNFLRVCLTIVVMLGMTCALQAYQAGSTSLSLAAVASPLELGTAWGEIYTDDQTAGLHHDSKLGHPGLGGELQALYFIHPRVGIGASYQDQYFAKDLASGWYLNTHTRMQNIMAVGHVFLTPDSVYKLYVPFGLGFAHTRFTMDFRPIGDNVRHFNYTGFAYYAGIGVEREVAKHFSLGLEGRYNGNRFHDATTLSNGHRISVYPKANFISVLVRLIYTF